MHDTAMTQARILLADDNEMIRDAVGSVLTMTGYEVLECENGAQTKAVLSAEPIDILLLDLQMPEISGYEVLDWLDSQNLNLSVVVCTGTSFDRKALESREVTVFTKPFRMSELLEDIASKLARTAA